MTGEYSQAFVYRAASLHGWVKETHNEYLEIKLFLKDKITRHLCLTLLLSNKN